VSDPAASRKSWLVASAVVLALIIVAAGGYTLITSRVAPRAVRKQEAATVPSSASQSVTPQQGTSTAEAQQITPIQLANTQKKDAKRQVKSAKTTKPTRQAALRKVLPTTPTPFVALQDSPGSAVSVNQQGGITAGTINVGPPPLLMNKEQQEHLTTSVKPFVSQFSGKKINISLHNANPETG
jgi:hypothetical protein